MTKISHLSFIQNFDFIKGDDKFVLEIRLIEKVKYSKKETDHKLRNVHYGGKGFNFCYGVIRLGGMGSDVCYAINFCMSKNCKVIYLGVFIFVKE